jgi:sugar phosphate isomerase/epimerase
MPPEDGFPAPAAAPGEAAPGVLYAGIGDEAGASLDDQIAALTRLGWGLIELRSVDGTPLADLDDATFHRCAVRLAEAGLQTACVDSRIAGWARPIDHDFAADLAELEVLHRRCEVLGTRYVRVMSYPNAGLDEDAWGRETFRRLRILAGRAEEYGLVLLHENCSGWAATSAARMVRLLEEVDSPALALLFDTGNGIAYHYDAHEVLRELVAAVPDRIGHVHVKDADGPYGDAVYTWPGEGRVRLADSLRLLLDSGFVGTWSIEPHVRVRPHEGLADAGADGVDLFAEYGRRLERLVRESVLPDPLREMAPLREEERTC